MKSFRDAGLQPTAIATAGAAVAPPESGAASWGATTRSSKPTTPPPQRRVVTAVPRQVEEPIRVVKPRRVAAALPPGTPILAPPSGAAEGSTSRLAQTTARPPKVPAFQTRVAARPAPVQSSSPSATDRRSSVATRVERGVGLLPQRQKPKVIKQTTAPWQVSSSKPQRLPSAWSSSVQRQAVSTAPSGTSAAAAPPKETADGVSPIGQMATGFGRFFASVLGGGTKTSTIETNSIAAREASPAADSRPESIASGVDRSRSKPEKAAKTAALTFGGSSRRFVVRVAGFASKERAVVVADQLRAPRGDGGPQASTPKVDVLRQGDEDRGGARYALRVADFGSLNQSLALCERMKEDGLACKVVPLY